MHNNSQNGCFSHMFNSRILSSLKAVKNVHIEEIHSSLCKSWCSKLQIAALSQFDHSLRVLARMTCLQTLILYKLRWLSNYYQTAQPTWLQTLILQFKTQPFYLRMTFWRNMLSNIPVSVFPLHILLKILLAVVCQLISISTNDESFQGVCVSSSFSLFLILRNIITWISCLTTCHVVNIILSTTITH